MFIFTTSESLAIIGELITTLGEPIAIHMTNHGRISLQIACREFLSNDKTLVYIQNYIFPF